MPLRVVPQVATGSSRTVQGFGLRVWGSGFRAQIFWVQRLGFWVQGSGFRAYHPCYATPFWALGNVAAQMITDRVQGSGYGVYRN